MAAIPPGLMFYWEQVSPSHVGKGGLAPVMRLAGALGGIAGFLLFYQRSLRSLAYTPHYNRTRKNSTDGFLAFMVSAVLRSH